MTKQDYDIILSCINWSLWQGFNPFDSPVNLPDERNKLFEAFKSMAANNIALTEDDRELLILAASYYINHCHRFIKRNSVNTAFWNSRIRRLSNLLTRLQTKE